MVDKPVTFVLLFVLTIALVLIVDVVERERVCGVKVVRGVERDGVEIVVGVVRRVVLRVVERVGFALVVMERLVVVGVDRVVLGVRDFCIVNGWCCEGNGCC